MNKSFLFFIAVIFVVNSAQADQRSTSKTENDQEKIICNTSTVCKKTCDLGIVDKFETLPPEQQQLVLHCAQDMMKNLKSKKYTQPS